MKEGKIFEVDPLEYESWFISNDQLFASELEAIQALMPNNFIGVEIGVGTGLFASRLGVWEGVEPSGSMAAEAIKKGLRVRRGVAEQLPLEDEKYTLALMVTVDCFLEDPSAAFSEVHRILKHQGRFIIAFLDKGTPLGKLYDENKHLHQSYRNAHFHTSAEIVDMMNEAGFEVEDCRQTIFSLENLRQPVEKGVGLGVFAVIRFNKKRN